MNTLRALLFFDFTRCRLWVAVWWFYCLAQAVASVWIVIAGDRFFDTEETVGIAALAYLLLAVLIGMLFRSSHPGLRESFFRVRPIRPRQVLASRCCFVLLLLVLPHFLAQLAPLLLVDASFAALTAFTVYYWSVHLGAVALLSTLATSSRKISSYLLRAFFGGAALLAVTGVVNRFSWRESRWVYVSSPEAAGLLWGSGLCVLGVFVFGWITVRLYQGRASPRLLVIGVFVAIALAAAWPSVSFRVDSARVGYTLPEGLIDLSSLSFEVRHKNDASYSVQRNDGRGGSSSGGYSLPPYWNDAAEEFWFIDGELEIKGIDPQLAYTGRMLTARWVAPDGEVIEYDPPKGTNMVRHLGHTQPPPIVTTARLDALLGEPPTHPEYFTPNKARAYPLLFGTWTSDYERFNTSPGRLELQMRVDFYQHELGQRIPLGKPDSKEVSRGLLRLSGIAQTGDSLEIELHKFVASQRWGVPMGGRWSHGSWNWLLYDPDTGQRRPSAGQSAGGTALGLSLYQRRLGVEFRGDIGRWTLPDLEQPAALELLYIQPHYLGSAVVDVTVDDFPLVTQRSIENALR